MFVEAISVIIAICGIGELIIGILIIRSYSTIKNNQSFQKLNETFDDLENKQSILNQHKLQLPDKSQKVNIGQCVEIVQKITNRYKYLLVFGIILCVCGILSIIVGLVTFFIKNESKEE